MKDAISEFQKAPYMFDEDKAKVTEELIAILKEIRYL